jgi:hypothetical protein
MSSVQLPRLLLYWRYNLVWVLASSRVLLHRPWRFRNSRFFRDGVAMVALLGAYSPASIALPVVGMRRPPLHDKAVVLEEDSYH